MKNIFLFAFVPYSHLPDAQMTMMNYWQMETLILICFRIPSRMT